MKTTFTVLLVAVSLVSQCQTTDLYEIKTMYDNLAYFKVIERCEALLDVDPDHSKYASYLANSYRLINDHEKSDYWLMYMVENNLAQEIDYFYLALAKKSLGQHEEAIKWFKHYDKIQPDNPLVGRHLDNLKYAGELGLPNQEIIVENVIEINSSSNDFGAVNFGDKVVFSSSRTDGASSKRTYKWDGQNYLDLFVYSSVGVEIEGFSSELNTSFHEGPICFSSDGKKAYFTRNNYFKGKKGKMLNGTINLKIYSAEIIEGKCTNVESFKHNSDSFSTGHVTLSNDGSKMVFISDNPEGHGGTDLYMCTKGVYGWESPINLGNQLNTEQNEMFPFLHENGTLYFSSNGHLGLGGLDIFKCEGFLDGHRNVEHLDAPLNSEMDDFSFYLNPLGDAGYLSSNRKGGMGGDDIYSFILDLPESSSRLTADVRDQESNQPLCNAKIEVWSASELIKKIAPDETGRFVLQYTEDQCPLKLKISNGENWSTKEIEVSDCKKGMEEVDLGHVVLIETKAVANVAKHPQAKYEANAVQKVYGQLQQPGHTSHVSERSSSPLIIEDPVLVNGVFRSYRGNSPISGLLVTVIHKSSGQGWQVKSDYNGELHLELRRNDAYQIKAEKPGFASSSGEIHTGYNNQYIQLSNVMNTTMMPLEKQQTIVLENIFYDLGKWTLREDAVYELNKLVRILRDNPSIVIELSSHTDSRGSNDENMKLSERRAMAAVRYIIDHGISPKRIFGKGYGETKLINECFDGTLCSEPDHQKNRRTEVKIINY